MQLYSLVEYHVVGCGSTIQPIQIPADLSCLHTGKHYNQLDDIYKLSVGAYFPHTKIADRNDKQNQLQ